MKYSIGCFFLLVFLSGCAGSNLLSKKSEYREDLSKVRPEFAYQEPVFEISAKSEEKSAPEKQPAPEITLNATDKQLNQYLKQLSEKNKSIRYISGFRIQLYVGNIRSEADAAKAYVYQMFEDITPYVTYTQPTYRVKAGDFIYRTDAERYLERIRATYSSAHIMPEKIEIKQAMELGASREY
jgi:type II secretory pathway component GspD/PulD (secretin)